jgi:serine/threonine-protein kinase
VHFAHAQGVLHLDIKPENVMIGSFGEVYVVDWGLAVSMRDEPGLPSARDVRSPIGTPGSMAPEMASGDGASLAPYTDVYLLGATLHTVVTGTTRHSAPSVIACVWRAMRSDPVNYPPSVPEDLARICNRATARAPADRFASVDALRRAVVAFLRHRSAHKLYAAAALRHADFEALADKTDTAAARSRFLECRFGYQQCLAAWEEHPTAREGLERALSRMTEFELAHDNPEGAAAIVSEMRSPEAGLIARVEAARARRRGSDARLAELERFREDLDLERATRGMSRLAAVMALLWGTVLTTAAIGDYVGSWHIGYAQGIAAISVFAITITALGAWIRRHYHANDAQRRLLNANYVGAWSFVAFWVLTAYASLPFSSALAVFMSNVCVLWIMLTVLLDSRSAGMAVSFGTGVACALASPRHALFAFAFSATAGFVWLWHAWGHANAPTANDETPRRAR